MEHIYLTLFLCILILILFQSIKVSLDYRHQVASNKLSQKKLFTWKSDECFAYHFVQIFNQIALK